jgi:hypothetical protein
MMSLPAPVLALLAGLPDGKPFKVILHTNGLGKWDVEIFTRHYFDVGPRESEAEPRSASQPDWAAPPR